MLKHKVHKGAQTLVKHLNILYTTETALYEKQFSVEGFEWIDHGDHQNSVMTFLRKGNNEKDTLVIILNLTATPRENYRIGLPKSGTLKMVFNSDAAVYNGTDNFKNQPLTSEHKAWNNRTHSLTLRLPPLAMLALKYQ